MRSHRLPAVELEPISPPDEEFVRQLAVYWLELGIAPNAQWAARYVERTYAEQGGPRFTFWALCDGRRAGFGMVRLDPDWLLAERLAGYICEFYVFPAERRRGVGTALARALIAFLRQRGAVSIDLDVLPDNRGGMAFWRSLGFDLSHHHLRLRA